MDLNIREIKHDEAPASLGKSDGPAKSRHFIYHIVLE